MFIVVNNFPLLSPSAPVPEATCRIPPGPLIRTQTNTFPTIKKATFMFPVTAGGYFQDTQKIAENRKQSDTSAGT